MTPPPESLLSLESLTVCRVYQQADGQGFNLYSYIPSVYDYPNQHVFWWYGTKKYGYQPADVSYLPNQPEYIKDNALSLDQRNGQLPTIS